MRQIKFRGLRSDGKGWVYGYYLRAIDDKTRDVRCIIFPYESRVLESPIEVIPSSVGQFTGLTDKNGKEIYEGDLLIDREFDELGNDISGHYPVIYSEKTAQFCIDNSFKKDGSHIVSIVTYFGIEDLEVVGTIHEGKEVKNV